ncbi:EscC/YscC/HrcC family type III secretion system outer membrane ring protein [Burkholderia sp. WAC0059]|uniref:type III secretion system outer membrane ring subunit SctC n=1 Tax=Burkholderia sp. WAC0059 TaxID=2066022 RepID=UPI000C7F0B40|nr:type III secretion system outer membrane ring subunit SctC [Burkholderia sp. WAC0059]PLZ00483.1 EscC/YscC/HrcC family type III secretion system outer membrane ring protein [Burkholderia sp. WAC0059]
MKWTGKAGIIVLFVLSCATLSAHAAEVHWRTAEIDYSADGKDLRDVLRDFAASEGIPANIAQDVTGTFSGKFHLPPQKFLDTLASSFGFVWYYDGQVLNITAASDMKSSLIKLDTTSTGTLRDALARMHVEDPRFPIQYDDADGTAIVNGPPSYVDLVTQIAGQLDNTAQKVGDSEVRLFPLHHAWAMDRSVSVDGNQVTLQGVATELNSLYHPGSSQQKAAQTSNTRGNITRNTPLPDAAGGTIGGVGGGISMGSSSGNGGGPLPPLPGGGMLGGLSGAPSPLLSSAIGGQQSGQGPQSLLGGAMGNLAGASGGGQGESDLPVILADQRTNSVIIRDLPDRMSQYQTIIDRLDVKPRLIEIEAHIIEIDDDALHQLGINWTAHNSHVDLETGNGSTAQNTYTGTLAPSFGTTTLAGSTSAAATPSGLAMSAVLGDAGRYLMANVNALEEDNRAKIDASPKVVTLDNIEADMDNTTQFFVPVSGYTSADLYSISTGVSLHVLPMVVDENGKTQIKLDVAIQDGELSGENVSGLPVITSSNINTQAFIDEGDALLIAGYNTENDTNDQTGVPVLSKIPLLGALFRSTDKEKDRMERLFLLTPKLIEPS